MTDIMQTYMFDYTLAPCYIEREHAAVDTVGANLLPEPGFDFLYTWSGSGPSSLTFTNSYYVVLSSEEPHFTSGTASNPDNIHADYGIPATGHFLFGLPNPCVMYVFEQTQYDVLAAVLRAFNEAGIAESIADVYMVPAECMTGIVLQPVPDITGQSNMGFYMATSGTLSLTTFSVSDITTIDGYTPRNNKLFTYPYSMITVGNKKTGYNDYRPERFTGSSKSFTVMYSGTPDTVVKVEPMTYNDVDLTGALYTDLSVSIPWTFSQYLNYRAQHAATLELAKTRATEGFIGQVMNTVGWGVTHLSDTMGGGLLGYSTERWQQAVENVGDMLGGFAESLGISQDRSRLRELEAESQVMERMPSKTMDSATNWSSVVLGSRTVHYGYRTITADYARMMDEFFTMYGYAAERLATPNRRSRVCFNYLKCRDCNITGSIDSSVKEQIEHVYESGVTFWHNDNMYDYTQTNTPTP